MKWQNILLLLLFEFSILKNHYAQVQFDSHVIVSDELNICPNSVFAIDIDNDGDVDILTSSGSSEIICLENNGNYLFNHVLVTNQIHGPASIFAIDIEGESPGTVMTFNLQEMEKMNLKVGFAHDLDVLTSYNILKETGVFLTEDVFLVAVQIGDIEIGDQLTDEVVASYDEVKGIVLKQISEINE